MNLHELRDLREQLYELKDLTETRIRHSSLTTINMPIKEHENPDNMSNVNQDIQSNAQMENTEPCCEWRQRYFELERRMAEMQKEMNDLRKKVKKDAVEVRGHCQHFYQAENSTKIEVKVLKQKLDILSNVVIRLEERFKETSDKLIDMQSRSMRKNLIISGLDEPANETNDQLMADVQSFIRDKLKVEQQVPLKIVHRLNYTDGSDMRPVVLKLSNFEQKAILLSHGPNLKGLTNQKNKHFYLNEQLPDRYAEDRRYAQHWIKQNKAKPANEQLQMKIHKNKLRVNNEPYKRKVSPPSAAEILRLDPTEIVTTQRAPTVYGDSDMNQGSEFISYAANVNSVEEVRVAYRKLRVKYPDASHIVSAYRLDPPNGPFNQEACDDGEHGGGRCLLSLLETMNVLNTAVLVIRFYGGKHIGSARFDIIRRLGLVALQKTGAVSADVNSNTGNLNRQATRRQTRSMSQRGRGRGTRKISHSQTDLKSQLDQFVGYQPPTSPMFRPTPANSPVVSPNQVTIGAEGGFLSANDHPASAHSQSEYEDPLSAREIDSNSNSNSRANSEADDEQDEEEQ